MIARTEPALGIWVELETQAVRDRDVCNCCGKDAADCPDACVDIPFDAICEPRYASLRADLELLLQTALEALQSARNDEDEEDGIEA